MKIRLLVILIVFFQGILVHAQEDNNSLPVVRDTVDTKKVDFSDELLEELLSKFLNNVGDSLGLTDIDSILNVVDLFRVARKQRTTAKIYGHQLLEIIKEKRYRMRVLPKCLILMS